MALHDLDIARRATLRPIIDLARERLGLQPQQLVPHGHTKAKLTLPCLQSLDERPDGKLILVTATSPTPAGEARPPPPSAWPTP